MTEPCQGVLEQEPIGIVISCGSRAETPPRVWAYVWGEVPGELPESEPAPLRVRAA